MNMALQQIRIGLSRQQPCSYIPSKEERVAIVLEKEMHSGENFEMLLANGFRRSGNTLYKPQCDKCQACQALRVAVQDFSPSKSQKRLWSKGKHLRWEIRSQLDEKWFELYAKYIEGRHASGSMYPPREKEFFEFADCTWLTMHYLHIYDGDDLVAIAITDILENSASAFYTFFDPDYELSLGTYAVLCQLEYCRHYNKQWLYLGYQIDDCSAMNYKTRFQRHQRLVNQRWQG
ncbi:arginyltransferase [Vibrio maritimus]|uniref:arginyltransferase n=1 Tax=Vibrio maritimus TaxID=990268 RepID=UPI001F1D820D|nr:arginyltransferase [Vibrio maritimus]